MLNQCESETSLILETFQFLHFSYHEIYPDRMKKSSSAEGVSITLNSEWIEPRNPEDQEHWDAAIRSLQFKLGMFAHPIFINGDYPDIMKGIQIFVR